MTLHGLQSATLQESPSSFDDVEPSVNPDLAYNEYLRAQGLKEEGLSDDLNAAGWDPIISTEQSELYGGLGDTGGSPVVFPETER